MGFIGETKAARVSKKRCAVCHSASVCTGQAVLTGDCMPRQRPASPATVPFECNLHNNLASRKSSQACHCGGLSRCRGQACHCGGLSRCRAQACHCGGLSRCRGQACHCGGLSRCRGQAVGSRASVLAAHRLQSLWSMSFSCPQPVESSWTRDQACAPVLAGGLLSTVQGSPVYLFLRQHWQLPAISGCLS